MKYSLNTVKFAQAVPVNGRISHHINRGKIEHRDITMDLDAETNLIHIKMKGEHYIVPAQGNIEYMLVEPKASALDQHLKKVGKKAASG